MEPFVSVIIPAYNEEKYIEKCLNEWVNQDYPKERYEILVYDGMSTDNTPTIIKKFEKKYPGLVIYKKNPKRRQVYAFNLGLKEAKGEFFMIFGAHAYPERDFLRKNIETFLKVKLEEPKLAGVGGKLLYLYENRFAKLVALLHSSPLFGVSRFRYLNKPQYLKTVVFALYDKEIAKKVGGFDEDMIIGDDFEFNLRINKQGYKLFFNPEIRSHYFARSSLKGFLKQSFNYGAARAVVIRKGYFSFLWLAPLGFLSFEVSLMLFSIFRWLFILYWLTLFGESIRLGKKNKSTITSALLLLPFFMFLLHNILSVGFILGLLFGKNVFR